MGAASTPFTLDPDRSALLVVDMQNDFVRQGAPQEVASARDTLPTIQRLITGVREVTRPVTKFLSGPGETLMWTWSPECAPPIRSCWPGVMRTYSDADGELEGPDIVGEIYPEPADAIVEKYGYDAFHHTKLADLLRANHVTDLIVVGTVTQICVQDTVHGAFHEGYRTVVVSDAVSSFDEELHRTTLRNIELKYGRVMSADEALAALSVSAGG
ncbi:MAG: cysteine hydrolase [Actinobacteria bacterium]|nr:cysteine hydrolase [Actinomycetota bacterium]